MIAMFSHALGSILCPRVAKCSAEDKGGLHVVLDLDATLLAAMRAKDFNASSLKNESEYPPDIIAEKRVVWLRPHVRRFLEEASQLATLYIFTAGDRAHADEMVRILDPEGKYFSAGRIEARDSECMRCGWGKDISGFGVPMERIILIDDMPRSVRPNPGNGILIAPFCPTSDYSEERNCARRDTELLDLLMLLRVLNEAVKAGIPVSAVLPCWAARVKPGAQAPASPRPHNPPPPGGGKGKWHRNCP